MMKRLLKCSWSNKPYKNFLLLLVCALTVAVYFRFTTNNKYVFEVNKEEWNYGLLQKSTFDRKLYDPKQSYLVWDSKCRIPSINPYDPSIVQFVKKEKYEACSTDPRLTSISRESNGSIYLLLNQDAVKEYEDLYCCWAVITRPKIPLEDDKDFDSNIRVGTCRELTSPVALDTDIQVVHVKCHEGNSIEVLYENTHAIIDPRRIGESRLEKGLPAVRSDTNATTPTRKALSVLMLGLDSVSRLNFYRTMPATRTYFEERGWTELRGYNKMGDNTFPNLMAILTGQNQSEIDATCQPKVAYGLDNCPMIWYNFRDAGYATAYAEDHTEIGTFNYLKAGFVEPPTDYYLRPYLLASDMLLKSRQRFGTNYCTGPELSADRIFDAAVEFSKALVNSSYFALFWSNTITHENINGPSLYDTRFLEKLKDMEEYGVMNDTMVIVFSDHGMRFGDIRETFVGWYEERLPFIYVWLPEWFREQNPESYAALRINQNRLTSPYDLYETLRDILQSAGGQVPASSGCPLCNSLFKPVPHERGCKDAGIAPHWCACESFESASTTDKIVINGANKFIDHMENLVKQYKNKDGNRLCSQSRLKRIIKAKKMLEFDESSQTKILKLFYLLEVTPGGGKFEVTLSYRGSGNYTIYDDQVSRINLYRQSAKCLTEDHKRYCFCNDSQNQK